MNGQVLDAFLGQTVEVGHSLHWQDETFVARLMSYDDSFVVFDFNGELVAIKKTRVLWISNDPDNGDGNAEYPDPEPIEREFDKELWGQAFS